MAEYKVVLIRMTEVFIEAESEEDAADRVIELYESGDVTTEDEEVTTCVELVE